MCNTAIVMLPYRMAHYSTALMPLYRQTSSRRPECLPGSNGSFCVQMCQRQACRVPAITIKVT